MTGQAADSGPVMSHDMAGPFGRFLRLAPLLHSLRGASQIRPVPFPRLRAGDRGRLPEKAQANSPGTANNLGGALACGRAIAGACWPEPSDGTPTTPAGSPEPTWRHVRQDPAAGGRGAEAVHEQGEGSAGVPPAKPSMGTQGWNAVREPPSTAAARKTVLVPRPMMRGR